MQPPTIFTMPLQKFIDTIFIELIYRETDPLNKARIKILGYILLFYLVFAGTLLFPYYYYGSDLQLLRISIIFAASIVMLIFTRRTHHWRIVAHCAIIALTLATWSNITIYVKDINIATMQYIWLSCVFSFYFFGNKLGLFYSSLNVLPAIAFYIPGFKERIFIGNTTFEVTEPLYFYVISYNFLLILFLQSYFFKSFVTSICDLKSAKKELHSLNKTLNQQVVEIEKLSSARINFLSTMSHEIRTPLHGVIGLTNVLQNQNPRLDQAEHLGMLKFSAQNLLVLVNNVLDITKLDSDKSALEKIDFNLQQLLSKIFASVKLNAAEKELEYKINIDSTLSNLEVKSDPTRLTQIILNLLNNSIKFTKTGYVALSAKIVNRSPSTIRVLFTIEDTGIGISSEQQIIIFDPFTQALPSTARDYGGTGLGLSIVKKTLQLFNSKINLSSEDGKGSKFTFEIEFDYVPLQKLHTIAAADVKDLKGLKVLVAEDNSISRMIISKILSQWNVDFVIVDNGLDALQTAEKENFDVILMDIHMPIMDGYQATENIRKLQDVDKSNVIIIALTASTNETISKHVKDVLMNDYLAKPFNPEDLYGKLKLIKTNFATV